MSSLPNKAVAKTLNSVYRISVTRNYIKIGHKNYAN